MGSDYLIILPIILAIAVLGGVLMSHKRFKLVYLIIVLILIGDFSEVYYDSVYACIPPTGFRRSQWDWKAFFVAGMDFQNYTLYVWLYMW